MWSVCCKHCTAVREATEEISVLYVDISLSSIIHCDLKKTATNEQLQEVQCLVVVRSLGSGGWFGTEQFGQHLVLSQPQKV